MLVMPIGLIVIISLETITIASLLIKGVVKTKCMLKTNTISITKTIRITIAITTTTITLQITI